MEKDLLCGHIECKKDTKDILDRSIAKPLNDAINRIGDKLVFCQSTNGQPFIEWGANDAAAATSNGATILHQVPVKKFVVGDLQF